ncbi:hypothetical protein ACFU9F_05125 [Streptomyces zhihengii]|uniref:cyanobactin maturation protease PatG family protein n=1 Tax=Streptomyces zhihengii TaxID=1818004 RepID=UPI0036A5C720
MNENENVPVPEPVLPPTEAGPAGPADAVAPAASPADPPPEVSGGCGCGCGGAGGPRGAGGHVYAVGRVEARFPDLGVEKELEQAVGRTDTRGMTDGQAVHTVLNEPANRYLARQMCWVLTIGGIDAYLLVPRDSAEVDLLVETVRPTPGAGDVDVVIGTLGGLAPPDRCNGLTLPQVGFEQLYSFDTASFLDRLPPPDGIEDDAFRASAEEVLSRVTELTDNTGSTDRHRAVNYLALRYPRIYSAAAAQYAKNCALTGVDTSRSEVSRTRTLIDVVFTYTDRTTNVADRLAARVDVTGMFPFLAAPLSPYCAH